MTSTTNNKLNTRSQVIKALIQVQHGVSLSNLLDDVLAEVEQDNGEENKAFVHNLLLTSLRHWHATDRLVSSLADKPIDEIEVRTCLQVGITQLIYLEVADHACIFETVEAVKEIDFARASGLVNAILRKVAKNPNKYRKQCDKKHSLPNWLAKELKQDWRKDYNKLCQSLRCPAPMFLRVNARQTTSKEYLQQLAEQEIVAKPLTITTELQGFADQATSESIQLEHSQSVYRLPHFETGMVSVQDIHASIAGSLVKTIIKQMETEKPSKPLQILDACTAPSGKLAHCLEQFQPNDIIKVSHQKVGVDKDDNDKYLYQHEKETTANIAFTAIDSNDQRLKLSEQTLQRLGLTGQAKLQCADASSWQFNNQDPEQFDLILIDAPCTATGVIRRHPDIGLLRQEGDIEQTVKLQSDILQNMWQQLKTNGYLIYATCSVFKAENTEQMQAFIAKNNNSKETLITGNWGIKQPIGRQCLPLIHDCTKIHDCTSNNTLGDGDGFYYAVLQKV